MDDVLKKRVSIGIAIGCLVVAIGITVVTNFDGGSGGGGKAGPIQMLCVNPACNNAFEMKEDEFRKLMSGEGGAPPMPMMMEAPTFKCPKCNEKSVYIAMKCEKEKCGNVFVPNYQNPADYDKCPKCGFSKYQQEMPTEQEQK